MNSYYMANFLVKVAAWVTLPLIVMLAYELQGSTSVVIIVTLGYVSKLMMGFTTLAITRWFSQKSIIVGCNVLRCRAIVIVAILAYSGELSVGVLMGIEFFLGAVKAVEHPTSNAYMANIGKAHEVSFRREAWRSTGRAIGILVALVLCWCFKEDQSAVNKQLVLGVAYGALGIAHLAAAVLILRTQPEPAMGYEIAPTMSIVQVVRDGVSEIRQKNELVLGLLLVIAFIQILFGTTFFVLLEYLEKTVKTGEFGYLIVRSSGFVATAIGLWFMLIMGWHKTDLSKSIKLICLFLAIAFAIQTVYPLVGGFIFLMAGYPLAELLAGVAGLGVIRQIQDFEGGGINGGDRFVALQITNSVAPCFFVATGSLPAILGPQWALSVIGGMGFVCLAMAIVFYRRHFW